VSFVLFAAKRPPSDLPPYLHLRPHWKGCSWLCRWPFDANPTRDPFGPVRLALARGRLASSRRKLVSARTRRLRRRSTSPASYRRPRHALDEHRAGLAGGAQLKSKPEAPAREERSARLRIGLEYETTAARTCRFGPPPSLDQTSRPWGTRVAHSQLQQPAGSQAFTSPQQLGWQHGTGQQTVTGTCLQTTTGTHRVTV
jgi:hypothetical protein